jgi:hypothetical protein
MWFNLLSMGIKAGTHIYKNKQQTKINEWNGDIHAQTNIT